MVQRYISSVEASNILGVNVSTIKRWTDGGKLDCVTTAGGHRKFLMRDIAAFLNENVKYRSRLSVLPYESSDQRQLNQLILKRHILELKEVFLSKSMNGDRETCQHIMNGLYLSGCTLQEIYDDLLTPVLKKIGNKWFQGKLAIYEEHIATAVIQSCIHGLYSVLNESKRTLDLALCIGLRGELHEIPLSITEQILLDRGFDVINMGVNTPLEKIETLFTAAKPVRLYISSTVVKDANSVEGDLIKLFALANSCNTLIFLGGHGFEQVRLPRDVTYTILSNFHELVEN